MPEKTVEQWYNFVVPQSRFSRFEKIFRTKPEDHKHKIRRMSGAIMVDVVFRTQKREQPKYIKDLMRQYDGVNISELERKRKVAIR